MAPGDEVIEAYFEELRREVEIDLNPVFEQMTKESKVAAVKADIQVALRYKACEFCGSGPSAKPKCFNCGAPRKFT